MALDKFCDAGVFKRHRSVHVKVLVECKQSAKPVIRTVACSISDDDILGQRYFIFFLCEGKIVHWKEILVERHIVVYMLHGRD